jgi:hypothetical protein
VPGGRLAPRWGLAWFALLLAIALAVMMVCYVAVPARIVGMRTAKPAGTAQSGRGGNLAAAAVNRPVRRHGVLRHGHGSVYGDSYEEVMRKLASGLDYMGTWRREWDVPSPAVCVMRGRGSERT